MLLQLALSARVKVAELALVRLDFSFVFLQVHLQGLVTGAGEGAFMTAKHQALEVTRQLGPAHRERSHTLFFVQDNVVHHIALVFGVVEAEWAAEVFRGFFRYGVIVTAMASSVHGELVLVTGEEGAVLAFEELLASMTVPVVTTQALNVSGVELAVFTRVDAFWTLVTPCRNTWCCAGRHLTAGGQLVLTELLTNVRWLQICGLCLTVCGRVVRALLRVSGQARFEGEVRGLSRGSEFGKSESLSVIPLRMLLQLADGGRSESTREALVHVLFTCVCLLEMTLQTVHVGRLKGTKLALEGFVVSMVGLHVSVQAAKKKQKTTGWGGQEDKIKENEIT